MSTAYQTALFAANTPAGTGHGDYKTHTSLHAVSGAISTWASGDTIAVGWLPSNAVVTAAVLKAAGQLDSNGSPTLALDLGVTGTAQLFKAAVTTVGHAAGASVDNTIAAAGYLYKNTSGARQAVLVSVHTAAATAVSGTLEVDIEYYVEDAAGSNP